jgi:hypothetical protein
MSIPTTSSPSTAAASGSLMAGGMLTGMKLYAVVCRVVVVKSKKEPCGYLQVLIRDVAAKVTRLQIGVSMT